jgi:putative endonuclease
VAGHCAAPAQATDSPAPGKPWFVYLVRAANGSLYCGISDDPQRRFAAHQSGKGARFFHSSPAVALVYVEAWPSKGEALRHERLIKKLRKSAKEALAAGFIAPAVNPAQ